MNILIETIYETVQGEGYFAGTPCTLIRAWGCPVGCWFCDTGYAKGVPPPKDKTTLDIESISPQRRHVVITGGEPMAQRSTASLVQSLIGRGHFVQVDTSGVKWADLDRVTWVTLSPKAHLGAKCADEYWHRADEVKIVVSDIDDARFYDDRLRSYTGRIYFQPEYGTLDVSVPHCIDACLAYGGRVSVQAHKLIGLP